MLLIRRRFPFRPFNSRTTSVRSRANTLPRIINLFGTFRSNFQMFQKGTNANVNSKRNSMSKVLYRKTIRTSFTLYNIFLYVNGRISRCLTRALPINTRFMTIIRFKNMMRLRTFKLTIFGNNCNFPTRLITAIQHCLRNMSITFRLNYTRSIPRRYGRRIKVILCRVTRVLPFLLKGIHIKKDSRL